MMFEPDWVAPPGDTITRLLALKEIDASELADELDMTSAEMAGLLSGEVRITSDTASILADRLGSSPSFWIKRDRSYLTEVERLESRNGEEFERWIRSFPVADLRKFGLVEKGLRGEALGRNILRFFNCENLSEWNAQYASGLDLVSFRTSSAFRASDRATLAWKRMGERQSEQMVLQPFDREGLERILPDLKKLYHNRSPRILISRLRERLSSVGVALTSARAVSGCRASGATWILSSGNPIIHLSFRHLSDDHLWFTIYHEAAHVVLKHGEHVGYDRDSALKSDQQEQEADHLAESLLVPRDVWDALNSCTLTPKVVLSAAQRAKASPGVLVGQLEKSGRIKHGKMSFLKRRFVWGDDCLVPNEK